MEQHNNTPQESAMSMNSQAVIDAFVERQRDHLQHLIENLTVYYDQFRSHVAILADKSNQRSLFVTILLSSILLTLTSLFFYDYRQSWRVVRRCFQAIFSSLRYVGVKIRTTFLQTTTPPILNLLLNSKSPLRQKFVDEFRRSCNEELAHRKVKMLCERDRRFPSRCARISDANCQTKPIADTHIHMFFPLLGTTQRGNIAIRQCENCQCLADQRRIN